jgi:ketosteroid isomerase-like protein
MNDLNKINSEQEVAKFIEVGLQFVRDNDAEAMETIFSDDYDLVVPTGDVLSKQQIIEMYRTGNMKQEMLEMENLQIRLFGDTAIARGLYRSEAKYNGQEIKITFMRTDVLAKPAGRWQIVTSQTTQSA